MNSKITLLFCGDFVSKHPGEIILSNDLSSLIAECDIKCINFEAPIENRGTPINKGGSGILTQPMDAPMYLESLGFNVIAMSNNHMYDYGEIGLIETQRAFKSSLTVGVGAWDTAYEVKILEVNEVKIGFLSLTHCEFGVLHDVWDKSISIGCAGISYPQLNKIIINAKQTVDYLFIIAHAGIEHINLPLPEWRDRYREFIDCGADAVVASHPHVPQGWENYKGRPIFYSLGNFFFDINSSRPYWNDGLIVLIDIDTGTKNISYKVESVHRNANKIEINYSEEMKTHIKYLCDILKNDDTYINELEIVLHKLWQNYQNTILASLNLDRSLITPKNIFRILYHSINRTTNLPVFLNMLRCESHLWALRRIVKLQQNDIF